MIPEFLRWIALRTALSVCDVMLWLLRPLADLHEWLKQKLK